MNTYFTPDDLVEAILSIAESKYMLDIGNSEVFITDRALQDCFNSSWLIYIPDLKMYCEPHITSAPANIISTLQNEAFNKLVHLKCPESILYHDLSSLFWLHPDINAILTKNETTVFSWPLLCNLFTAFVTTNTTHFRKKDNGLFEIKEQSPLAKVFRFKYFHIHQIESILKRVTKFLGKSNTLAHCCTNLSLDSIPPHVIQFIDSPIHKANQCSPYIHSFISI